MNTTSEYLNPFQDSIGRNDDTYEEGEIQESRNAENTDNNLDFDFILENSEVNENFLHKFEILGVLKGNMEPIDDYMDEVAYKNLDSKINQHKKSD